MIIKNTLLATTLASGLIVPAAAGVYLPPKPAIVKPENLDFSKNLLAMPFTLGMLKGNSVAVSNISFISAVSAASTSVTLGTHAAGDIIIIFAGRAASSTPPTLPSGWTNINSGGSSTASIRIGYKVAASSSETSGTWTNASRVCAVVYRGVSSIGTSGVAAANTVTSATTPALTLTVTNNTSWVVGGWSVNQSATGTPDAPSGTTSRLNANNLRAWDSGAAVSGSTFGSTSSTMSSQSFAGGAVELVST